ncbi:hypothetical protein [Luteimonas sp. MC1750]|uniref:hypothetical protein n=1 Tax=Luteimonas sp. MC1750 TaxID=2799326 RepID=UPI0018F0C375|nr:hypothetical protein [Luteimonas sp. MC1750]MBJ6984200.1 hypothetical protein [Luteimonas sp. MC1750]QQO07012.1 hypothetical protein JGR68_06240 [Luteimonas sp. MC1750]
MSPDRGVARVLACFMGMLVLAATLPASGSTGKQDAYWAGFAFTGDASTRAEAVPHTNAALGANGVNQLNARLVEALQQQAPAHIAIVSGTGVAQLDGSTSATVLAAAIDRELVSVESIGGRYKVLVELAMQALFFDFRERQVIAAYPITLQHIDLIDQRPTPAQLEAIVYELIHGSGAAHLPQALAHALADVRLPNAATRRLQVGAVTLTDTARQKLPTAASEPLLRATLAHELSKTIAGNTGIGVLPPASGEAIGKTMAARFSDGRVFQLSIPEPDYVVELQVDDWRRGVINETAAMRQELFGAFFSIRVTEPHSGTVYFHQPLRKGATKVVPATQTDVDAWSASYDTLLAGFDSFAKAASAQPGHRDWLGEQKPGGRPLQQQTKALQELIQSCR